jgi:hypothetical protein
LSTIGFTSSLRKNIDFRFNAGGICFLQEGMPRPMRRAGQHSAIMVFNATYYSYTHITPGHHVQRYTRIGPNRLQLLLRSNNTVQHNGVRQQSDY